MIEDINEKPTLVGETFTVEENVSFGFSIGTLTATDEDSASILRYEIVNQELDSQFPFAIDLLTGEITVKNPILNYEHTEFYSFEVKVSDNAKEPLSDVALITVQLIDVIEDILPSSDFLSPNGDGMNDTWQIDNVELYSNYQLSIYSAHGQSVYELSDNYQNDWNGTLDGADLPPGTYYYFFRTSESEGKVFKGTITLVR